MKQGRMGQAARGWIVLSFVVLALLPSAALLVHWIGVIPRFGVVGGLRHAAEYALLPTAVAVLRVVAVTTLAAAPLHLLGLLGRSRWPSAVASGAVAGLVVYLVCGYLWSTEDWTDFYSGGFRAVWIAEPPSVAAACALAGFAVCLFVTLYFVREWYRPVEWRFLGATGVVWGAVIVAALGYPLLPHRQSGDRTWRNVVLVCMDTLRADHLGIYGYHRDTSPHIDRLARTGTVFDHVVTQAPWTLPAHMSLFTGLYPWQHGLVDYVQDRHRWRPVSEDFPLLAEILAAQGYTTSAFTGGGFVDPAFGFGRGFDRYRTDAERLEEFQPSVHRWLRRHRAVKFFLFLHFYNCHRPYRPPPEDALGFLDTSREWPVQRVDGFCAEAEQTGMPPSPAVLETVVAHYDGEVRFADRLLAQVSAELERWELLESTLIVFTSDHGEEFFEHGNCDHIKSLYDPALKVPLVLAGPDIPKGVRIRKLVELRDVSQLILDYLRIPHRLGESSHLPWELVQGLPTPRRTVGFSETCCKGYEIRDGRWFSTGMSRDGIASIQDENAKLVCDADGKPLEYYDLAADPGELRNLLADRGDGADSPKTGAFWSLLGELRDRLGQVEEARPGDELRLDEEVLERLRSLGYLD